MRTAFNITTDDTHISWGSLWFSTIFAQLNFLRKTIVTWKK